MWKSTSFCLRLSPRFQLIPPLPSLSGKTADMPNTDNLPTNSLLTTALSPHKRYAGSLNHQEIVLPGIYYLLLAIAGFCTVKKLKLPAISGTRDGNFKRINTLLPQNPIKSCINFYQELIKRNKKYFIPNLGKKKSSFLKIFCGKFNTKMLPTTINRASRISSSILKTNISTQNGARLLHKFYAPLHLSCCIILLSWWSTCINRNRDNKYRLKVILLTVSTNNTQYPIHSYLKNRFWQQANEDPH